MRSSLLQLVIVAASLVEPAWSGTQLARAAEPTPSEISVARRLFEEGKAAEDAGRWAEGASKFRQAATIKDTPGLRFHAARCEEEQGAFVEALVEYDRARELLDGGVKAPDVEKLLADARERVRAKVALLTLRPPEGVTNVSVEIDGKPISSSVLGVPMPINPGRHRLRAVAVGRTTYSSTLEVGAGEVRNVELQLPVATTVPAPAPAAAAPAATPAAALGAASDSASPSRDTPVSPRTVALIGEASLFAVGLGTGIAFSVVRADAASRYDTANRAVLEQVNGSDPEGTACNVPRSGCSELVEAQHDRDQASTIALAGFIAAGASAVGFGLTYWLWPEESPQVHVGAAPGSASLAVSGRF
jgi:hypothetical protein